MILFTCSFALEVLSEEKVIMKFKDRKLTFPDRALLKDIGHRISIDEEDVFLLKDITYSKSKSNYDGLGAHFEYEIKSNYNIFSPDSEKSSVEDVFSELGTHFFKSNDPLFTTLKKHLVPGNVIFSAVNWDRRVDHQPKYHLITSEPSILTGNIISVATKELPLDEVLSHYRYFIGNIDLSTLIRDSHNSKRGLYNLATTQISMNYNDYTEESDSVLEIYDGEWGTFTCENCYFTSNIKFSINFDSSRSYCKISVTNGDITLGWKYTTNGFIEILDYKVRATIFALDILNLIPGTWIVSWVVGLEGGISSTIGLKGTADITLYQESSFKFSGSLSTATGTTPSFSLVPTIGSLEKEFEGDLSIQLSLGPAFNFTFLGGVGLVQTYIDPYLILKVETEPTCPIVPIYYSTFIGLDLSADAALDFYFGSVETDFSINVFEKELSCGICNGCVIYVDPTSVTTPTPIPLPTPPASRSISSSSSNSPSNHPNNGVTSPSSTRSQTPTRSPTISKSSFPSLSKTPTASPSVSANNFTPLPIPSVTPNSHIVGLFEQYYFSFGPSNIINLQLDALIDYISMSEYSSYLLLQLYVENINDVIVYFGTLNYDSLYTGIDILEFIIDDNTLLFAIDINNLVYYNYEGESPLLIDIQSINNAKDVYFYAYAYEFKQDLGYPFSISSLEVNSFIEYEFQFDKSFDAIAFQCTANSGDVDLRVSTSTDSYSFERTSDEVGYILTTDSSIIVDILAFTPLSDINCLFAGIFSLPVGLEYNVDFSYYGDNHYIYYLLQISYNCDYIEIIVDQPDVEILFTFIDLASYLLPVDVGSSQFSGNSFLTIDVGNLNITGLYPVFALVGEASTLEIRTYTRIDSILSTITDYLGGGTTWAQYYSYQIDSSFPTDSIIIMYIFSDNIQDLVILITNNHGESYNSVPTVGNSYYAEYYEITIDSTFAKANDTLFFKLSTGSLPSITVFNFYINILTLLTTNEIEGIVTESSEVAYTYAVPSDWFGAYITLIALEGDPNLSIITSSVTYQSNQIGTDSIGVLNDGNVIQIIASNNGNYRIEIVPLQPTSFLIESTNSDIQSINSGDFSFSLILTNDQFQYISSINTTLGFIDIASTIYSADPIWATKILPLIEKDIQNNMVLVSKQEIRINVPAIPNLVLSRDICLFSKLNSYDIIPNQNLVTATPLTIDSATDIPCLSSPSSNSLSPTASRAPSSSHSMISKSPTRTPQTDSDSTISSFNRRSTSSEDRRESSTNDASLALVSYILLFCVVLTN